jgi:FKBP-type peptidyl-prolyl cis-trans isomerase
MTLKINWIVLFGLALFAGQANADQPIVLDNQTLGQPTAPAKNTQAAPARQGNQQGAATAEGSEAIRPSLKARRISPRERAALRKAEMGDQNKEQGQSYLAENAARKGVVTLPSGVQYRVLRAGKGRRPTAGSRVMCRYVGTLIDGRTFDKTDKRKPAMMNIDGFVQGLREAVMHMPTGSKWEIVIPPQLAFGPTGNRGVAPNAVVKYQMEILSVR